VGTVDYMAPEQSVCSRDIDARSDIYSLGCVFFHLLTGRLPFEGPSPIERLALRMKKSPPPPSQFRADVPEEIDAIAARMLHRNRERRFRWPIEVAEALEPFAIAVPHTAPKGKPPKPR
jgi:serine/threonine protein kinase